MVNFPTSLDAFTNPTASDATNSATVPHATQHSNLNDAVEALEAKVGIDGSAVTSSLDYKVANKQGASEEKSSNFTAALHGFYLITATCTVTDPGTPSQGHEFTALVRNGTATVGGTAYSTAGTVIRRIFHSGSWTNYAYQTQADLNTSFDNKQDQTASATDSSTGTINALSITGSFMRLTGAAPDLRGMTPPYSGKSTEVKLYCVNATTLRNQAGTASAANRIQTVTGADFPVPAGSTLTFAYDTVSSTWRQMGPTLATSTTAGLAPISGGGTTNFLRADLTWAAPSGGSSVDYSCRLRKSSGQSLNTTLTALSFDTEDFDTDTMHDNVTNNTRITFTHAGKYMVGGIVATDGNAYAEASLLVNGTTTIAHAAVGNATSSVSNGVSISTIYSFTAGQYVELLGAFGSAQTSTSGAGGCNFWAFNIA